MSLLGIDVGTAGCKAAAFSLDGTLLADAYREYPTLHPREGWAELDSRRVVDLVKETIAQVAAATRADPVTADGRILAGCILQVDVRGGDLLEACLSDMGQEAFYRINPNILAPNYTLPKLLWLRANDPALWAAADRFLLWGDLVGWALGCEPVTSFSLANRTLLFDIRREDWSDLLLDRAGIDRAKLPRCAPSGTVAGTVADGVADDLGLPRGVAVVVGGHDQCCSSLGAGVAEAGKAVCGIGTVECITPTYDHIPDAGAMLATGLSVEHHVLPGLYVSFVYNQAGSLVRWFRDTFASADRERLPPGRDIYDALAAEMPAEPTRLLVLPYFEPTGSPHYVRDAAGAVVGLKTTTTRGQILKAIMESVTFYFVEPLEGLRRLGIDTSQFVATGGGARSDAWLQIKADVLGVPLVRPAITECGVLGAAMLAGLATGRLADPAEAIARFVRRDRVFEPDPRRHALYRDRAAAYRRLYPALKDLLAGG
ncbi:MAG TPA: FGGY family carbohydrate kinase [Phycisphaerae bacterium]|nr:FGGY family carbohydrate kinase [Phycisphaerae bacterium]